VHNSPHLPDWMLDLLAEGALSHTERVQAEAHVKECAACASDLEAARAVLVALDALPRFEPSPGFADAVMARVVIPGRAAAAERSRRWLPRTRRGWARLGAAVLAPLAPLATLLAWLLTHPMVTAGGLWEMGVRWAGERLWSVVAGTADLVARSGAVGWIGEAADRLAAVPTTNLGIALLVVAAAIPLSGWFLLRLFRTPVGGIAHAH
jgi:CubicO group peptidase (beta-lactamase class C family)